MRKRRDDFWISWWLRDNYPVLQLDKDPVIADAVKGLGLLSEIVGVYDRNKTLIFVRRIAFSDVKSAVAEIEQLQAKHPERSVKLLLFTYLQESRGLWCPLSTPDVIVATSKESRKVQAMERSAESLAIAIRHWDKRCEYRDSKKSVNTCPDVDDLLQCLQ